MANFTFHVSQPAIASVKGIGSAGQDLPFAAGVVPAWSFVTPDGVPPTVSADGLTVTGSTFTAVIASDKMSALITPTSPIVVTISETPTGLPTQTKSVEFTADFATDSVLTVQAAPTPAVATNSTLTVKQA